MIKPKIGVWNFNPKYAIDGVIIPCNFEIEPETFNNSCAEPIHFGWEWLKVIEKDHIAERRFVTI